MPATHQGSNFSAVASFGVEGGGAVIEANYVTTKKGEFQMFMSHGEGLASTQAGAGYSMGVIEGKNFRRTSDFSGNYVQGSLGVNSSYVIGGSADAWGGVTTRKGKLPKYSGVWGYDFALTGGTPDPSGSLVFGNAIPANEVVDGALKKLKLSNTRFGQAYSKYAEKVTHFQLSGFGLFVCRTARQCGRSWTQ